MDKYQLYMSGVSLGFGFFLTKDEKLWSFGNNAYRKCSMSKDMKENFRKPTEIKQFYKKVKTVSLGRSHTFITTKDNLIYACGDNFVGQLSLGDIAVRYEPTLVTAFKGKQVEKIIGVYWHSIFILSDGIYGSGNGRKGQLGTGDNNNQITAVKMKINEKMIDACGGNNFTIMLSQKQEVFFTGNLKRLKNAVIPVKLGTLLQNKKIVKIAAASGCFFALSGNGCVYGIAPGSYDFGKFDFFSPGSKIVDVKCGSGHAVFLDDKQIAYGYGNEGTLGMSIEKTKRSVFRRYQCIHVLKRNIVQILCNRNATFLFTHSGDLWAGGENGYFQLGLGSKSSRTQTKQTLIIHPFVKNVKCVRTYIVEKLKKKMLSKIGKKIFVDVKINLQ